VLLARERIAGQNSGRIRRTTAFCEEAQIVRVKHTISIRRAVVWRVTASCVDDRGREETLLLHQAARGGDARRFERKFRADVGVGVLTTAARLLVVVNALERGQFNHAAAPILRCVLTERRDDLRARVAEIARTGIAAVEAAAVCEERRGHRDAAIRDEVA